MEFLCKIFTTTFEFFETINSDIWLWGYSEWFGGILMSAWDLLPSSFSGSHCPSGCASSHACSRIVHSFNVPSCSFLFQVRSQITDFASTDQTPFTFEPSFNLLSIVRRRYHPKPTLSQTRANVLFMINLTSPSATRFHCIPAGFGFFTTPIHFGTAAHFSWPYIRYWGRNHPSLHYISQQNIQWPTGSVGYNLPSLQMHFFSRFFRDYFLHHLPSLFSVHLDHLIHLCLD
jgi:hypothetical protein